MSRRGVVLFSLMSVIWGIPYLFIRVAVAELEPATLVFLRTGIAALILLPIALARVDLRRVLARWRWVLAFAAVEIAIPWVLLASAEQQISSSLAGLLVAGVPLVGATIALLTRSEHRISGTAAVGLLIGLAGVAAIVGGDFQASNVLALVQMAGVVVCYAVGPFILSRWLTGLPSIGVMATSLSISAIAYAPFAALTWPASMPGADVLWSVLILAVVCTAIAFLLFAALIGEVGPVRATVITYVNPAVAAVLGVVVLDETFTLAMGVGFALVIVGSSLATRRPTPAAPATSEPLPGVG
jgi:drug/metabolite transporter (DMT)-like permease